MSIQSHLKRFPNARTSTIAYLVRQDAIHQELRRGLESKPSLLRKLLGWIRGR